MFGWHTHTLIVLESALCHDGAFNVPYPKYGFNFTVPLPLLSCLPFPPQDTSHSGYIMLKICHIQDMLHPRFTRYKRYMERTGHTTSKTRNIQICAGCVALTTPIGMRHVGWLSHLQFSRAFASFVVRPLEWRVPSWNVDGFHFPKPWSPLWCTPLSHIRQCPWVCCVLQFNTCRACRERV